MEQPGASPHRPRSPGAITPGHGATTGRTRPKGTREGRRPVPALQTREAMEEGRGRGSTLSLDQTFTFRGLLTS